MNEQHRYENIRDMLERDVNMILCNCGEPESCAICEHLHVCAMVRRLKTVIADDKRPDKPANPISSLPNLQMNN